MGVAFARSVFVAASLVMAGAAQAERTLEMLAATDLPGGDYQTLRDVPISVCRTTCLGDTQCAGFTYNERANWCFLKSTINPPAPYDGATSARVVESAPADALPMPTLDFLPEDLPRRADDLAALVAAVRSGDSTSVVVTMDDAVRVANNDANTWRALSDAYLTRSYERPGDSRQARELAAAAAYLSLEHAATPAQQGRGLQRLSRAFEAQGLFRPAINASAASLTFLLDPSEETRQSALRRQHGFRVLDYSVDNETLQPRLCVQFSEEIEGSASQIERFVSVADQPNVTLTVDDKQLCVEGLTHGERIDLTVRSGLPSTVGEDLVTPADITAFVRDRAATARFETNRYVLPASARGVPVTTVNSQSLELALYKVNDRSLVSVVREGNFKSQLYRWNVDDLEEGGIKVWDGTLSVAREPNREVRTLAPVGNVIASAEPGVYVLTARPQESADTASALATQWFVVSDLGLATYTAGETVDVFVRGLDDAAPKDGVSLTLVARNNAVLATAQTDADGHAHLVSDRPADGPTAPAVVTAQAGEDYAFVSLVGPAMELTDRGVAGRAAPGPVDAFLATERGVYRAGETVHLTALVRDDEVDALALPVTLKLVRPDGKLSRRLTERTGADGGLVVDLPLTENAATGTWTVAAHIDPNGPAVGSTRFLVEDFVPQRIEASLTASDTVVDDGDDLPVTVEADFLYGAPAADLILEGSVTLSRAETLDGFDGYVFGLDHEPFAPRRTPLFDLPRTGPDGTAQISVPIPQVDNVIGAVEARVQVSVREPGGRQVPAALTLPVQTGNDLMGLRPLSEGGSGGAARFEVIALSQERSRIARAAKWTLTRISRSFQWYRRDNRWFYQPVERTELVASGTIDIAAETPARISAPVDWGQYRLEVIDASDARVAASHTFYAGWAPAEGDAETPDNLTVSLDAERYSPGDTATVRIAPRYAGEALVTVLSGAVRWHQYVSVPAEGTSVEIPVSADWTPGAYVAVTLVRPGDPETPHPIPRRAIGVAHMDVGTDARRLSVTLDAPDQIQPGGPFQVPVVVDGLAEGEVAHLTVAAVDVGILNLTGYEPPDADGHYLGQRQLGVELRDVYGDVIDASGAAAGRMRSGGDGTALGNDALPPNEEPVSLFSGRITTGQDGRATATFWAPPFNGTLRVMAIVWSDTKVGDASTEMVLRDPVVMSGSLPRFLAPSDASRLAIDLHNLDHLSGRYVLSLSADGPVSIDGRENRTLDLDEGERTSMEFGITATGTGTATITAQLTAPDGLRVERNYTLAVRPAAAPVAERRMVALTPGETTRLSDAVLRGFDDNATVTLSVGLGVFDVAGLLNALDRFPYGCAEQTTSRALPLVYANELARTAGLDTDATLTEKIDGAIARVLSYQSSAGGFGLWSPGDDMWLTAYVMDFLSRAREAGHAVADDAFTAGLDRLQSTLSYVNELDGSRGNEVAYATYVLARNGRAAIGDVRYFAEEKWDEFETPIARAQLAASVALAGDQTLADRLFASLDRPFTPVADRADYGSVVRDAAATVTLAAESRTEPRTVSALADRLAALMDTARRDYSTQEAAWMVMSASATTQRGLPVSIDGARRTAPFTERVTVDDPVTVANDGRETLAVATTVRGTPLGPLPATSAGLAIERTFLTLDGEPVRLGQVRQNERLVVKLTVRKTQAVPMRLMLTDLLPAGFEIENPRLMENADLAGIPAPSAGAWPEYTAFRDDRFAAAWTLRAFALNQPTTVSYVVRAVSPGTFTLPAAEVSDMYQPQYLARTTSGTLTVVPTR